MYEKICNVKYSIKLNTFVKFFTLTWLNNIIMHNNEVMFTSML